jgi:CBS-domain-containing membrane protein
MTPNPVTIAEETPLDAAVSLLDERRIWRLPVVRPDVVVGIVSRATLLHALASLARERPNESPADATFREQVCTELNKQRRIPKDLINVVVRDGVVEIWGTILDERGRQAVGKVGGGKDVQERLVWVGPMSGTVFEPVNEASGNAKKH